MGALVTNTGICRFSRRYAEPLACVPTPAWTDPILAFLGPFLKQALEHLLTGSDIDMEEK